MRRLLLTALLLCTASTAWAQATATPTNTPVPPTSSPTMTPTLSRHMILANAYACAEGGDPCVVKTGIKATTGHKTVSLATIAGTGSTTVLCVSAKSWTAPEITMATMSGVTPATKANVLLEFDTWCEELYLSIPAGATVSAWLRIDTGQN